MTPDPAALRCTCARCGHELWKVRRGDHTLQTRLLKLLPDDRLAAVCPECRAEIPVSFLAITKPARRARRLVVRLDRSTPP